MQIRRTISITISLLVLAFASYMYYETGNYKRIIVLILIVPIALSLHPVFKYKANELNLEPQQYKQQKLFLNVARFTLCAFGIFLFLIQLFTDIQ